MGANLLMTVILGVVFVALVVWVAVRLRAPRHREEDPVVETRPDSQRPEPEPQQPIVEVAPEPEPPMSGTPLQTELPRVEAPTPVPEIDADIVAAAEPERSDPVEPPKPEIAARIEILPEPGPAEPAAPPEPVASPEPEPPPEVLAVEAKPKPKAKRKRPARRKKKKTAADPRPAQTLGVPAIVHDAYRNIRTWTTSLTPGRTLPSILSDPEVERGDPTTYRFNLKQIPYSIVKTDLTEHDGGGVGPLVHEKVQLLDDKGTILLEMSLITADIGSDETPGEVTAFTQGPWLDDFRELNTLSSKDSKRIGTDFRKKFRAKEQVRLKRDFGV